MLRTTLAALLLALLPVAAGAKEPTRRDSLLPNGSFEQLGPGRQPKDTGQGAWRLPKDKRVPLAWSCNVAYPGTLAIDTTAPAHGKTAIRLSAETKNDTQLFQPCPGIRPGTWYRISMQVRGGTAMLLTYEYPRVGKPVSHVLGSLTAPKDSWRTLTGFYTPQGETFEHAAVTVLVPRGGTAFLDDVQVHAMDGPVAAADARSITLKTRAAALSISGAGHLQSFTVAGEERAIPVGRAPILTVRRDGLTLPIATLTKKGSALVARFPYAKVRLKLRAKVQGDAIHFEILEAKPKDLETAILRFPIRGYAVRDAWMPGTYGDDGGIALMGVSPNTHTRLARQGRAVVPEARWDAAHGIRGGVCALLATAGGRLLPAIRQMEKDTGLPSPTLPSAYGVATASRDWVRASPAIKQSYLFVTYLGMGDIDQLIQYAQVGGFGLILLARKAWRASAGHEEIARTAFPEGLPTLKAVCERIHAAGLGVGLHLYGPAVSTNDAYVTPLPDKRLYSHAVGKLAAKVSASTTELVLDAMPALPRVGAPDVYPGNLLRLGDEIIRWKKVVPGTSVRITGCERGALGTTAAAHRKKATLRTLVLNNGGLLVDPDSTLPDEMGGHLARVVNTCKVDLVYFDAVGGNVAGRRPANWYYLNKVLLASCAQFDHGVIVQTGQGPGRQLAWHLVPRSASADGHGDLRYYLDKRMAGIAQMRRTHTAADLGWYALDIHGRPDELEYVCAKALALDASVSVQAHKPLLEAHPRAREVFEMIAAWERRRRAGDIPEKLKGLIGEKGRDVHLLETDDVWTLWEAEYEPARPIAAIDDKANLWTVTNKRKKEIGLTLEIERVPIAATPADHRAESALCIDALRSAKDWKLADDEALRPNILYGGRAEMAVGFARRGTTMSVEAVDDTAVGGRALEIKLASTIGGVGWGAAGLTLPEPLDLSGAKSLGLWMHGDGRGATCVLTLADAKGHRVRFPVPLDYRGWRFQSFPRKGPAAMDWSKTAHVIFELVYVPPRSTITARVAALHAMPSLHAPAPMPSITVVVGRRELTLKAALQPGQVITIDAIGRAVWWQGGMREGAPERIAGGPLRLAAGPTRFGIKLEDASGYAGDLRVRVCRTWLLGR